MSDLPLLEGVEPVWLTDYWDGVLEGLASYRGRGHWFRAEPFDPDEPPKVRRHRLYALTEEEAEAEHALHDLFRTHVGTHWDYAVGGTAEAVVRPKAEWAKFYESAEAQLERDYTSRPPVGWFTLD